MSATNHRREHLLERFDRSWEAVRNSIVRLSDDEFGTTMPSGWTAKEMLGHLAFWAECTKPVVIGMLRGDVAAMAGWRFGSGYVADDTKPWPVDTIHNAREAEWARQQPRARVVDRLDRAIEVTRSVIESLTDDEASDPKFVDYLERSVAHIEEHGQELAPTKSSSG